MQRKQTASRPERSRVGRPTKFTPEIAYQIVTSLAAGDFLETAARSAGVSSRTLRNWMKAGEDETSATLHEFWLDVEQARAQAEIRDLQELVAPDNKCWTRTAWLLERRHPDHWRRKPVRKTQQKRPPKLFPPLAFIDGKINEAPGLDATTGSLGGFFIQP